MAFQHFDTLIAGDDISGLVAANLLTHFHYKVIVIRNTLGADKYLYNGFTLPISPYLMCPLDFGELMTQCKQYLSISQSEFENEAEKVEKVQYITNRLRVDLSFELNDLIDEFYCELDIKKDTTKRFVESAIDRLNDFTSFFDSHYPYPVYSFWDRRRFDTHILNRISEKGLVLAKLPMERERLIFRTLLLFMQGYNTNNTLASQEALLGYLHSKNWILLSSVEKIKSLLIKRLTDKGVLVLDGALNKYSIEKRGFYFYLIDERDRIGYRIDSVMISSSADSFKGLVSDKLWSKLNIPEINSYVRYTANFVLPLKATPDIASKVIFVNKHQGDEIVNNSFQLTISKAMRGRAIIKEYNVASVTFFIKGAEFTKKNADILNKKAKEVLLYVFPFAEEGIISESSVLEAESLFDVNLNVLKSHRYTPVNYLFSNGNVKDGLLLSDIKTGLSNFINVSSSVFTPLGILGDFMIAIRGAEIISKNILGK